MNTENNTENNKIMKQIKMFNKSLLIGFGVAFMLPSLAMINLVIQDNQFSFDIFKHICGAKFSMIVGIALIVTVITDANNLIKAGYKAPSKWWSLITPVYLWKRANILKESQSTFWIFLALSIGSSILESLIEVAFFN